MPNAAEAPEMDMTETADAPVTSAPQTPFTTKFAEIFKDTEEKAAVKEPAKADTTAKEAVAKSAADDIKPPSLPNPKAKDSWESMKAAVRAAEAKVADTEKYTAAAAAAEAKLAAAEARLAEREAKLAEYDGIVTRARLDDHPDFRREFIDGRSKLIERAQTIIDESGGDKDAVATALNLKGRPRVEALREIAGDLDNFQSGRLGRVIDELTDLDARGDAKRATAADAYKELQEQDRQREIEGRSDLVKRKFLEFEDTTRRMRGELEVFNKVDGDDAWNAKSETIVREAKEYMDANPHADVEAVLHARAMPVYRELFLAARTEGEAKDAKIAEMEAELKGIHGKRPGLTPRSAEGKTAGKSFTERMEAAFSGGE